MADAAEVAKNFIDNDGISHPVLIPNIKGKILTAATFVFISGFENFYKETQGMIKEIAVFTSASETFSIKNTNCSISDSLEKLKIVARAAKDKNIRIRGYVSCIVKCPYEGVIHPENVLKVATELLDMGCYEISLGDTIGAATPGTATTNLIVFIFL